MDALLGRKRGMTRVYAPDGRQVPVTVLEVGPCVVVQCRTPERDGYGAAQLGLGEVRERRLSRPARGHFAKHGGAPAARLMEVPLAEGESVEPGAVVTVAIFDGVGHVDVTGVSKGRGFQGVMKRHGMGGQPASHGHTMHRRTGSVGMREWPGRVLKNKKMPGHMGHRRTTTQNLRVVQVRPEDHLLLVEGSVPGPTGGLVEVRKALKKMVGAS